MSQDSGVPSSERLLPLLCPERKDVLYYHQVDHLWLTRGEGGVRLWLLLDADERCNPTFCLSSPVTEDEALAVRESRLKLRDAVARPGAWLVRVEDGIATAQVVDGSTLEDHLLPHPGSYLSYKVKDAEQAGQQEPSKPSGPAPGM